MFTSLCGVLFFCLTSYLTTERIKLKLRIFLEVWGSGGLGCENRRRSGEERLCVGGLWVIKELSQRSMLTTGE